MYKIKYHRKAEKSKKLLKEAKLDKITKRLIEVLKEDPFMSPPSYEKLQWELKGLYSRRINAQHRLVYKVNKKTKTVYILSMWGHYE